MIRKTSLSASGVRSARVDATRAATRMRGTEAWPPCVLVVDDDDELRSTIASVLRADRCEVVEVSSSIDLLDRLASYAFFCSDTPPPDLVVCNTGLLGFCEAEIVEALCALRPHTPVVLMGEREGEPMPEVFRIGPSAVLSAPVDISELRKVVLEHLPDDAWLRGGWFS